jgi:hypothetical protein
MFSSVISKGHANFEFRIRRWTVQFPTNLSLDYVKPPFYGTAKIYENRDGIFGVTNPLPVLADELDVTKYVVSYRIDEDDTQIISTASLDLINELDTDFTEIFRPNDYVIIEERYINPEDGTDTGWIAVGHFLVDGVSNDIVSAQGNRGASVSLRSPLKLLQLDVSDINLSPDKIFIPKTAAEWVNQGTVNTDGYYKFRVVKDPGPPKKYYTNWADSPQVRIWVKYGNSHPRHPGEELQIRGSDGSLQVVGGEGALLIDKDFFELSWNDLGLDNPLLGGNTTPIYLSFWVFCSEEDVFDRTVDTVTDGSVGNLAKITVTSGFPQGASNGNKTIRVLTGAAKGQTYRVVSNSGQFLSETGKKTAGTVTGGTEWTGQPPGTSLQVALATAEDSKYVLSPRGSSGQNLVIRNFDFSAIPDVGVTIEGIEITNFKFRADYSTGRSIGGVDVYVSLDGGTTLSPEKVSISNFRTSTFVEKGPIGGNSKLWGLSPTVAQIKSPNFSVVVKKPNSIDQISIDYVTVTIWYRDLVSGTTLYVVRADDGSIAKPASDGLQAGDTIRIGDANLLEDVIFKALRFSGFQHIDSTKPFFINNISGSSFAPVRIPPYIRHLEDEVTYLQALEDIINSYAPPNYQIYIDRNGYVNAEEIVQKTTADLKIDIVSEHSVQNDDFLVYSKVITRGKVVRAENIASHLAGTAISQYLDVPLVRGVSLLNVIDNSARTPKGGVLWKVAGQRRQYGEYADLFCLDLGYASGSQQHEIGEIELIFPPFPSGERTYTQIFAIFYMDTDAYWAYHGAPPPPPVFPPKSSKGWKLLVDDFVCQEGEVSFKENEFEDKRRVRARWIKVVAPRWLIVESRNSRTHSIHLQEISIFSFEELRGEAVLGITAPFDTTFYKQLRISMRDRTWLSPEAIPWLDNQTAVDNLAKKILNERYRIFFPVSVSTVNGDLMVRQTVELVDPRTGMLRKYLVKSASRVGSVSGASGVTATLVDYQPKS